MNTKVIPMFFALNSYKMEILSEMGWNRKVNQVRNKLSVGSSLKLKAFLFRLKTFLFRLSGLGELNLLVNLPSAGGGTYAPVREEDTWVPGPFNIVRFFMPFDLF